MMRTNEKNGFFITKLWHYSSQFVIILPLTQSCPARGEKLRAATVDNISIISDHQEQGGYFQSFNAGQMMVVVSTAGSIMSFVWFALLD